jgi:hypothetical protein
MLNTTFKVRISSFYPAYAPARTSFIKRLSLLLSHDQALHFHVLSFISWSLFPPRICTRTWTAGAPSNPKQSRPSLPSLTFPVYVTALYEIMHILLKSHYWELHFHTTFALLQEPFHICFFNCLLTTLNYQCWSIEPSISEPPTRAR